MTLRTLLHGLPTDSRSRLKRMLRILPEGLKHSQDYHRTARLLRQAERWTPQQLQAWQLAQLQATVRFAFERTEGYRELYSQAGVRPEDIRSLADIKHLPFTTKQLLQENVEAFSVALKRREYVTTGGSTGIPFGFYNTTDQHQIENAFVHDGWRRRGWRAGQPTAILRGAHVGNQQEFWQYDPYWRELKLSSYFLNASTLPAYIRTIQDHRARVLQAYPSALNMLCDLLKDAGFVGALTFDVILLASENIYDWQMEKVRRTFPAARVAGFYGHCEKAIYAPWCEHRDTYHVSPLYGLTEILDGRDDDVPCGAEGELVGTSFFNRATPFIRYRTMDRAVYAGPACDACGRPHPVLERIAGRSHEVIVTSTGRFISMTALNMHDDIFDDLRQFQFFQEVAGEVIFRCIPKSPLDAPAIDKIRAGIEAKLGHDMILGIAIVDEISRTKAGKYRFLDQRLSIKYGDN